MRTLSILAVFTVSLLALTSQTGFTSQATTRIEPEVTDQFANYDIRSDSSADSAEWLSKFRGSRENLHPQPAAAAVSRYALEYNRDLRTFEVISAKNPEVDRIVGTQGKSRARVLRDFVTSHQELFGPIPAGQLVETADYENPSGNMAFAHFDQHIGGIPVFAAEVKAGFSRDGQMFRVINTLAPGIDQAPASSDFGSPESAVVNAAGGIGVAIDQASLKAIGGAAPNKARFSSSSFSDTVEAEKFYFPIGNGVVRAAWRVLLWTEGPAYYVVVDGDGTLLWRKNITEHQSVPATYNVYGNSTSLLKTADSPSPFTPGCNSPTGCSQPAAIARTNFTLIGNEVPYSFNNLGWIPDAGLEVRTPANPNITDGNNVEAGIDRASPNGIDDNGWAVGNPNRVFSYAYNPAPGLPPPGEDPLPPPPQPYPPTAFQQGVITHGFYMVNRWHDEMYLLGFTEQARNFQHFNFGRGGQEGDRLAYEVQDSSGTNSGSISVPGDGTRPRLVMMIFTNPTPDRDGTLDGHISLHELTHALSGRLHSNSSGLGSNMARGLGEGWSDFYPLALLSEPSDNPFGIHALSGYVTYQLLPGYESNYYYGYRRFPVAVRAAVGANGLPHNPLTFRYVNADCNTLIGTTTTNPNSAFPRGPIGTTTCDEVHNIGEVWAVALWEVRDQLIQRLGAAEGNRRVLQYVTDGMKLSPLNPTMLQARDSIITAAAVSNPGDVASVVRGFAIRGFGLNASVQTVGTGSNNTSVTESFSLPTQYRRPVRSDYDNDGRSDIGVFRPSEGNWYVQRSTEGFMVANWGLATDEPVPDDYDGDGKTDFAIYRATAADGHPDFYILHSSTFTISYISWGTTGDVGMSEDFDGDNKADPVIFRSSSSQFWIRRSSDGAARVIAFPSFSGTPFVADFDGDGRGDVAKYGNGSWLLARSEHNYASTSLVIWGQTGDKGAHADYDGDGRDDFAVYRPSDGKWYIANSTGGTRTVHWGISTDVPAPGDYDGDGKADQMVYRDGIWYLLKSSDSGITIANFGLSTDSPIAANYLP